MCGDKCTKFSFFILVFLNTILILLSLLGSIFIGLSLNPDKAAAFADKAGKATGKNVDLSALADLVPKSFLYGGLVVTVFILLIACCGCCGAITMKRAADNSKSESDDEYDYADLNESATTSPALLAYLILMLLFIIIELVMGAGLVFMIKTLTDAEAGNEENAKLAKVNTAMKAMYTKSLLITSSKDVKIQKEWAKIQTQLGCCGMWYFRDGTEDLQYDKDGEWWDIYQTATESTGGSHCPYGTPGCTPGSAHGAEVTLANYGESCCPSDDATWAAGVDPVKATCEDNSGNSAWLYTGYEFHNAGVNSTKGNINSCNAMIFNKLAANIQKAMIFCFMVFVVELFCFGAAIHLRCCAVKKSAQ